MVGIAAKALICSHAFVDGADVAKRAPVGQTPCCDSTDRTNA